MALGRIVQNIESVSGSADSCPKTKGVIRSWEIVVDGFRNANRGNLTLFN
jgi:hypothetical protein